jgi:hypothetical protein
MKLWKVTKIFRNKIFKDERFGRQPSLVRQLLLPEL